MFDGWAVVAVALAVCEPLSAAVPPLDSRAVGSMLESLAVILSRAICSLDCRAVDPIENVVQQPANVAFLVNGRGWLWD